MDGKLNAICQSYTFYRLGAFFYALPLYSTNAHVFYRLGASRSHAVPVSWFIYVYTIIRNILQIGVV
jgi:hypothetical protein